MSGSYNQNLIDKFTDFFKQYYSDEVGDLAERYPKDQQSLYIDYDDLYVFDSALAEDFTSEPDRVTRHAEEALRLYDLPVDVELDDVHVRLVNLPDSLDIRRIRVRDNHVGSLVAVKGKVRKTTDVRPKIVEAAFECQRCGTFNNVPQVGGSFEEPHECHGCERQGPFRVNYDESEFIDAHKVRIQESPEGLRGGETPQSIDVSVEHDISGQVTAGDQATVVGTLRIEQPDNNQRKKSQMFDLYVDAMSITVEDEEFDEMDITDEDEEDIVELSNNDSVYELMVDSIAPGIHGYREEKLAMLLQLLSGVTKNLPDGSRIRGDIHVLLIGDPGTGKSQMLSYVGDIAPRSVYTSGKGSSSAGLTAAAVQDDFGEGDTWTLEAGALVMADKGTAAVDELDKMRSSDRSAMHEALEQQQVSVAKAGINATLKSRCSLLGAANPKYGRFDEYEPIAQQIDLEPALISRFDLIFTVTDKPDEEEDAKLADHVLQANYAGELNTHDEEITNSTVNDSEIDAASKDVKPPIETDLLRKYIAYVKRECYPMMEPESRKKIKDFYVDLRSEGADEDSPVPVTARKLEALVRLAEASARVRLSDSVTEDDADRAIRIVKSCLNDIGIDPETGEFDADIVETGTSKTQRERIHSVKEVIQELEEEYDDGAPEEEVKTECTEAGMDSMKVDDEIEKLRRKGEVYEPSTGNLRTT